MTKKPEAATEGPTIEDVLKVVTDKYGGLMPPDTANDEVRPMAVHLLRNVVKVNGRPPTWKVIGEAVGLSESGAIKTFASVRKRLSPHGKPHLQIFIDELKTELGVS
jgi:hypothetical protein